MDIWGFGFWPPTQPREVLVFRSEHKVLHRSSVNASFKSLSLSVNFFFIIEVTKSFSNTSICIKIIGQREIIYPLAFILETT